jgi:hypothetical protein
MYDQYGNDITLHYIKRCPTELKKLENFKVLKVELNSFLLDHSLYAE